MSSDYEKLPAVLAAKLRHLVRAAFRPVVEDGDPDGPLSKMGGRPWLPEGTEWPACPNCHEPMQLLLQLDTSSLPAEAPDLGGGLIQLFYCTTLEPLCAVDCEAFYPFSRAVLARRLDPAVPGATPGGEPVQRPLPARAIRGWEALVDIPHWDELEQEEIEISEDEEEAIDSLELPAPGDKLGGWPFWVQSIDYPQCPECGHTMRLVFQIDSEDTLPILFGDAGCGHLTQCPDHKDVLAFCWACA